MIRFHYTTPWEVHWQADTISEMHALKRLFTATDFTDTRHKAQFGYFPKLEFLDTVHHRMTHGQVIQAMHGLQGTGIQCETVNPPPRWVFETGEIPVDYLPGIKLRRFQRYAIQIMCGYGHGIGQAGTGAGKTVIMGGVLKAILERTQVSGVLIMIMSKDLLNQTAKRFEYYGVPKSDIGIIHSGISAAKQVEESKKRVVLSTHLSISKFPGTLERCQYVLCDEAHNVIGPLWTAIFNRLPSLLNVLGFTATPWDEIEEEFKMRAVFGQILYNIPMKYLISNGWLMNPKIFMINVHYRDRNMEACKTMSWQSAKKHFILEDQSRNLMPVVILKRIRGRMLVIYDELEHGERLKELYEQQNIPTMLAEGKDSTKQRQTALDWFSRELTPEEPGKVLLASRIFNEGVDLDNGANLLCIVGAKAKQRIAAQRLGRALRINSEGWVLVFDFWDGNQKNIQRWSSERKKCMEDLGFEVERIDMADLIKVFDKHPSTWDNHTFRHPVSPE